MSTSSKGWSSFWLDQQKSFHAVMRLATAHFASQLKNRLSLNAGSRILDYGCGPGFLEDELSSTQSRITGADIHPGFLAECRSKHPTMNFILITTSISENEIILRKQLQETKFDYIIVLSIFQYFNSVTEVEQAIVMLRNFLSKNGKLILADVIDQRSSSASDAAALFKHCLKAGKLVDFVKFIFYVLSSDYRRAAKSQKLLHVSELFLREVAQRHALNVEVMPGLTIHPSRSNYILSEQS